MNKTSCIRIFLFFMCIASMLLMSTPYDNFAAVPEDSLCYFEWFQDERCSTYVPCFDSTVDGKEYIVPRNVNEISKRGLRICLEDLVERGGEIIYIMDLSGSMNPIFGQDAGDPYKKRPEALDTAFSFQIDSAKKSLAGYIGFHSNVESNQRLKPTPVNTSSGINALRTIVQRLQNWVDTYENFNTGTHGTNYKAPLDTAIKYFRDPGIQHCDSQAIIFISDGDAQNGAATWQQINTLKNMKIRVHGIFLGKETGADLRNLCNETGGQLYLVPPNNTDTLAKVLKNIVANITTAYEPADVTLSGNGITANAIPSSFKKNEEPWEGWWADFDRIIPLYPGKNDVTLRAEFTPANNPKIVEFTMTLNVSGDPDTLCYKCRDFTKLQIVDNNLVPIDTLTWKNDRFDLLLTYYGIDRDSIHSFNVTVTTQKGDKETIRADSAGSTGDAKIYRARNVQFSATAGGSATQGNNKVESDLEDIVLGRWQNPLIARDTAVASVPVSAPPNDIRIYDKKGDPSNAAQYKELPDSNTVTAGNSVPLFAKVFSNSKWLDAYESDASLYNKIKWSFIDPQTGAIDTSIGTIAKDSGYANSFYPKKAYCSVDIIAQLSVGVVAPIKTTIRLHIRPGLPSMLVIEQNSDSTLSPNKKDPYDPISIQKDETTKSAYAILRDKHENWVCAAASPQWNSFNTSIVTVASGSQKGQGIITRVLNDSGVTQITAQKDTLGKTLIDTSTVRLENYNIDSVRIVRIVGNDTIDIENLTMNQNQDTTLQAIGLRSTDGKWILIDANWGINPELTEKPAPANKSEWTFSPKSTGSGVITIVYTGKTDTTNFVFTVGPVTRIEFELLTPDSLLIAGTAISAAVRIYNDDGLVPGEMKFEGNNKAKYGDQLESGIPGANGYLPFVYTDIPDSAIIPDNSTGSVKQTFHDGYDTLNFVLYNAPPQEPPHQLYVYLNNVPAFTRQFILKPGPLDTIVVDPSEVEPMNVTDPGKVISAEGYDKYGNKLPNEPLKWKSDSTLVDYAINVQSKHVYIDPSEATKDQEGYLVVSGVNVPEVKNQVYIVIYGPKPTVVNLFTRDFNGNGYLDAIEMTFDRDVVIPDSFSTQYVIVDATKDETGVYFSVDSIGFPIPSNKKLVMLYLREDKSTVSLQTGWKPYVTLDDMVTISHIKEKQCEDGAGPVIATVVKKVMNVNDPKEDIVTVTLSEDFQNKSGQDFLSAGPTPIVTFNAWKLNGSNADTVLDTALFEGIKVFNSKKDYSVAFKMSNGKDLSMNHLLNIVHDKGFVADKSNAINPPNENNRKVPVKVMGNVGDIQIIPNPIIPNFKFFKENKGKKLHHIPFHIAKNIVKTNGGAMIVIEIKLPITDGQLQKATAAFMVFDLAGNLVYSNENNDNIIPEEWQNKKDENEKLCIIWHGFTSDGRKTAPGLYRMVFFLKPEGRPTLKYTDNAVIGRDK